MGLISQDYVEIYASGAVPSTEEASSVIDTRGLEGIVLTLDILGGGYAAVKVRPERSHKRLDQDAYGGKTAPTASNQEWAAGMVAVWDSTNDRSDLLQDVSRYTPTASGTADRIEVLYDVNGATAMRFKIIGDTLTGPDAGAVQIRASRIARINTGGNRGI